MLRAVLAIQVAVLLAASGCAAATPPSDAEAPSPSAVSVAPARTPQASVPVAPATAAPVREAVPPVALRMTDIDVDMPVVAVGVETDFMELPEDPAVAGWYRFGADPTSEDGNIVLSAHVDAPDYPIGPLSRLRDLAPGSGIELEDGRGGIHGFRVESVTYYPKQELPVDEIFARTGSNALVVITCGGAFDASTGRYADNVVAIATPLG